MMRSAVILMTVFCLLTSSIFADEISIEGKQSELNRSYSRLQLVVSGKKTASSNAVDLTRKVKYSTSPSGIVEVNPQGQVTPLANGKVLVTATTSNGKRATKEIQVTDFSNTQPVFYHDVMPIISKHGCNICHGKPRGQNGFKLSLFGFDPTTDYESIVVESRGRRVFPAAPEQSLILQKASGGISHGGGKRFEPDSVEYKTMRDWMRAAVPIGNKPASIVAWIEVFPNKRIYKSGDHQQLRVIAHYEDGSVVDVTHLAIYSTNDTLTAEVDANGYLSLQKQPGGFTVGIKYEDCITAFRGSVPFGPALKQMPKPRNYIDEAEFAQLKTLGIPPSQICDDATFIRRVTLDIAGRVPTLEEVNAFLKTDHQDSPPGSVKNDAKRDALIDRLLASPDYADFFANKWIHLLRNRRSRNEYRRGSYAFHHWIRKHMDENKPYDEFVRGIVAATGDMSMHPPATWYRDLPEPKTEAENMAQAFLGVRITCARCHHHPFEKWSQKDYYQLTAFFAQVDRKPSLNGYFRAYEKRIFHKRGLATAKHPVTGEVLKPAALGSKTYEIDADTDPRQKLVDWMTESDNPFFATVLVNRYWKHFFGRGIVEPEDDLRETNPPSNPQLLAALKDRFITSGFDMKSLIRDICRSKTYQLSAISNEINLTDERNFSRYYPKRLNAEVLHDAMDDILATSTTYAAMPAKTRAVQLPDTGSDNEFLKLFGKPKGETSCECERVQDGDLRQSLFMFTASSITTKLNASTGTATFLFKDKNRGEEEKIQELYLRAFARSATASEIKLAADYLRENKSSQKSYGDLLWVLINTKEFMYNK